MVNDEEWFWSSEYGRDTLLRKELEAQAEALAASRKSQQRDTSKLRSELRTMQGSLERPGSTRSPTPSSLSWNSTESANS